MKVLFFFLFTSFIMVVKAQKIERAIKNYKDKKYERALEMFTELKEKDKSDVASVIGIASVYISEIEELSLYPGIDILKQTVKELDRVTPVYMSLSPTDKAFIFNAFAIQTEKDLRILNSNLSYFIWNLFISDTSDIELVEDFKYNYLRGSLLLNEVENHLSNLHYNAIIKADNLEQYINYSKRFPSSIHKKSVIKRIAELEYLDVMKSKSINQFKSYLNKYPNTEYKSIIDTEIANYYLKSIDWISRDKSYFLSVLEDLKLLENLALRDEMIDSCQTIIFEIEKNEVLTTDNLIRLNAFLNQYSSSKMFNLSDVEKKRNSVWKNKIKEYSNFDIVELVRFIKETSSALSDVEELITIANIKLTNELKKRVENILKEKISYNANINNNILVDQLAKMISNISEVKVELGNELIFKSLKEATVFESSLILNEILNKVGIFNVVNLNKTYFKPIDDHYKLIEVLRKSDVTGFVSEFYELSDIGYEKLSKIKINYPIFNAIKNRYKIFSFSSPELKYVNDNGYFVELFGYNQGSLICCPNFVIEMQWIKKEKELIPLTAISINNYFTSIPLTKNLEEYISIDKLTLFIN